MFHEDPLHWTYPRLRDVLDRLPMILHVTGRHRMNKAQYDAYMAEHPQ